MDINKLYQQTILEYSNRKDLKKEIDNPTDIQRGHNPSCGDDLTLVVKIKDELIEDASFIGSGCAISSASSAMLVELIKGKSLDETKKLLDVFFKMMYGEELSSLEEEMLEEAKLLEITKDMPARIKCSTLSWHSLKVIIDKY
ncbi:Fe-S cluster assembly sulfur transfer protein SufU [Pseudostreptobacillus sp.]